MGPREILPREIRHSGRRVDGSAGMRGLILGQKII